MFGWITFRGYSFSKNGGEYIWQSMLLICCTFLFISQCTFLTFIRTSSWTLTYIYVLEVVKNMVNICTEGIFTTKKNVSFFYTYFLYLKQPSLKKSKYIDYSNAFTSSFSSRKKWQYVFFGSYHILYLIDYHFWNLCSIKMFKVLQIISNLYKILSFSLVFTFLAENHL